MVIYLFKKKKKKGGVGSGGGAWPTLILSGLNDHVADHQARSLSNRSTCRERERVMRTTEREGVVGHRTPLPPGGRFDWFVGSFQSILGGIHAAFDAIKNGLEMTPLSRL